MDILKTINFYRRKLMKKLTRNIGSSKTNQDLIVKSQIKRVLISRPNHRLGNMLLITPLIQEVSNTFPDCKIDLFVKGNLGPIVFKNYSSVDEIIKLPKKHFHQLPQYIQGWLKLKKHHYDLVINVVKNSSSGRLSTQFANAGYKFFGDAEIDLKQKYGDYGHIGKYPVYDFRNYLSQLGINTNEKDVPFLDIKLSPLEISEGKEIVQKLNGKEGKTICLFTFATAAKCYSKEWWMEFYGKLKSKYPNYNFIEVLPVENISQINFVEPSFYSKDIREIGSVINNTAIFIGADSGVMHLATAAKTPTVGLFSVTDPETYEPYGPASIGIDTNKKSLDDIIMEVDKILIRN